MLNDIRYAIRIVRREFRHTLFIGIVMALAIGATTVLFGVTYGVLLKPLPWPNANRIVLLGETRGGNRPRFGGFSNAAFHAWNDEARTLETIAAWSLRTVAITGTGNPERVRIVAATASLFRVLGVRTLLGTTFDESDEQLAHGPVVVLSESLWRERFGADASATGRALRIDGELHTIVGVLPDEAAYPDRTIRAWIPYSVPRVAGNSLSMFNAIALTRADASAAQAAAEGTARGLHAPDTGMTTTAIFGSNGPLAVSAVPLTAAMTSDVRRPLFVLLIAVALLLLAAIANVASLQLARATTRRRELAIRAALGASVRRATRQLVIENLVLAFAGGAAGLLAAAASYRTLLALLPADFPRAGELGFDLRIVLFGLGASLVAGLAFGLLPALQARRINLVEALADDSAGSAGPSRRSSVARMRLTIMAAQVAVACVLLIGASLLGRSFLGLLTVDRGYDPGGVLAARLSMPAAQFTAERRQLLTAQILERLGQTPGVARAAFTSEMPLSAGGSTVGFDMRGPDGMVAVQASPRLVSPDLFNALSMRVVSGRGFTAADTDSSVPVAVVNQAFAARYLRGSAVGAEIPMGIGYMDRQRNATIVGVLNDVRYLSPAEPTQPEIYFSAQQMHGRLPVPVVTLLLRTSGDPARLAPALRAAATETDPGLIPDAIATLESRILTGLARPRLYAVLIGSFAMLALLVAVAGLFGVLSYTVAQRSRELAVRSALGATRGDITRLVLHQGGSAAAAGVIAGVTVAAALTKSIGALLYGVTPYDRTTFIVVPLTLLAVSAVACAIPARRASRLDPLRTLRG